MPDLTPDAARNQAAAYIRDAAAALAEPHADIDLTHPDSPNHTAALDALDVAFESAVKGTPPGDSAWAAAADALAYAHDLTAEFMGDPDRRYTFEDVKDVVDAAWGATHAAERGDADAARKAADAAERAINGGA